MSRHLSEIQPDAWSDFLGELSREHHGRIVSIEINSSEPADRLHMRDVPLEGLSLALHGNEEVISIVVREHGRQHTVHTVHFALRMTYEKDGEVARRLLVETEDGRTATVWFQSVSVPETVQGQTMPEAGE
jgi:uncharacterized protein DUF5335